MGCCLCLFVGLQRLREELDDFGFGAGSLDDQLEDGDCRRIQQMSIPGQGIEDNRVIVKALDTQPIEGSQARGT